MKTETNVQEQVQKSTDLVDLASKRVGTRHEEEVIGGRAYCRECGWIDQSHRTPTLMLWHGDSFK